MLCSVSAEVCGAPVVCRQTGYIYERRVIEKALESNGALCPHTAVKMSLDDLIDVQTDSVDSEVIPTPPKTDVTSVLKHVQNEWDARSIEIHELRQTLLRTRQELATALYRLDSANRVMGKLRKEASQRQQQQAEQQHHHQSHATTPSVGTQPTAVAASENGPRSRPDEVQNGEGEDIERRGEKRRKMDDSHHDGSATEEKSAEPEVQSKMDDNAEQEKEKEVVKAVDVIGKWPDDLLKRVQKLGLQLMSGRKGRTLSQSWATVDEVSKIQESGRCVMSNEAGSVESVSLGPDSRCFIGLSNGWIKEVNTESMEIEGKGVDGHNAESGGVRSMWWDEGLHDRLISGGGDGVVTVKNWKTWETVQTYKHNTGIVNVQQHSIGDICLIGEEDGWTWRNIERGDIISQKLKHGVGYQSSCIHPDGMMFATGCVDGGLEMWDVGSMECVNRLGEKTGAVTDIAMSEKGYYMATCRDGVVDVWDLRKRSVVGRVNKTEKGVECRGVSLDGMGEFGCAVGDDDAVMFLGKKKAKIVGHVALDVKRGDSGPGWRGGAHAWGNEAKSVFVGTNGVQPSLIKLTVN